MTQTERFYRDFQQETAREYPALYARRKARMDEYMWRIAKRTARQCRSFRRFALQRVRLIKRWLNGNFHYLGTFQWKGQEAGKP